MLKPFPRYSEEMAQRERGDKTSIITTKTFVQVKCHRLPRGLLLALPLSRLEKSLSPKTQVASSYRGQRRPGSTWSTASTSALISSSTVCTSGFGSQSYCFALVTVSLPLGRGKRAGFRSGRVQVTSGHLADLLQATQLGGSGVRTRPPVPAAQDLPQAYVGGQSLFCALVVPQTASCVGPAHEQYRGVPTSESPGPGNQQHARK